jgi:hypothetical protein
MASLKTIETDALTICMIQRGLTVEQFAADCGVKRTSMSNQIAKNFPSTRLRLVVEGILNLAIWSSQAEFESRQRLAGCIGFDPFVLTMPELRQRSAVFYLQGRRKATRKADLIRLIQQHFNQR